jgi:hypothetical protein
MPESYFVECACGASVPVELWKAGSTVPCPRCREAVKVPNSVQLKLQSGDKYPHLSLLQKIKRTSENREDPFQGNCHCCLKNHAEFRVTVIIQDLKERAINEPEHPVVPIITPFSIGVSLRKGEITDETWETATVPVLFCVDCHNDYERSIHWRRIRKVFMYACILGVLIGVPLLYWSSTIEPVFTIGGSCILAAVVYFMLSPRDESHPLFGIINKIRWMGDCLRTSMEYRLVIGKSEPYSLPKT